jgi:hypothetical protein
LCSSFFDSEVGCLLFGSNFSFFGIPFLAGVVMDASYFASFFDGDACCACFPEADFVFTVRCVYLTGLFLTSIT